MIISGTGRWFVAVAAFVLALTGSVGADSRGDAQRRAYQAQQQRQQAQRQADQQRRALNRQRQADLNRRRQIQVEQANRRDREARQQGDNNQRRAIAQRKETQRQQAAEQDARRRIQQSRQRMNPQRAQGTNRSATSQGNKTYQTYTKRNPKTREVYSGRTSGTGTAAQNVARRDAHHHMNQKGFGPAQLDKSSTNKAAIRGREQQLIDKNGGAKSQRGKSGNQVNGISPGNKKRQHYLKEAKKEFGKP